MTNTEMVEALYSVLGNIELSAEKEIWLELSTWDEIVKKCTEAGGLACFLPAKKHNSHQIKTAVPFLKRSLTDLRVLYSLIKSGYTSQAASVAASLWENALTAAVIADSEVLAKQATSTKYSEIPWTPKELAKLDAIRQLRLASPNKTYSDKELEDSWTVIYLHYKWLCQIKHPTWQSVMHDLKTFKKDQSCIVFPLPNTMPEDLHVKFLVLGIAVAKTLEAVKSFFLSLDCDENDKGYDDFEEKISFAHFGVLEQTRKFYGKEPPVQVLDRRFIKTDFSTLIDKFGENP